MEIENETFMECNRYYCYFSNLLVDLVEPKQSEMEVGSKSAFGTVYYRIYYCQSPAGTTNNYNSIEWTYNGH